MVKGIDFQSQPLRYLENFNELYPNDQRIITRMAYLYDKSKRYKEAIQYYEQITDQTEEIYKNIADCYNRL